MILTGFHLALACSVLALLFAGATWYRAGPQQAERRLKHVEAVVAHVVTEVEGITASKASWRVEQTAFRENMEELVDTVERKRSRAAASASRAKRDQPVVEAPSFESLGRPDQLNQIRAARADRGL